MGRSLCVRTAEPADEDALGVFLEQNDDSETVRHFNPFPLEPATAERLVDAERDDRFYVLELADDLVGLMMLRGWDEGYEVPSFGVLVDRGHRDRGLGRFLTDFAIAESRRLGCPAIRLSVYGDNDRARAIYESRGFEEVERESVTVDDESRERIVMRRPLGAETKEASG